MIHFGAPSPEGSSESLRFGLLIYIHCHSQLIRFLWEGRGEGGGVPVSATPIVPFLEEARD